MSRIGEYGDGLCLRILANLLCRLIIIWRVNEPHQDPALRLPDPDFRVLACAPLALQIKDADPHSAHYLALVWAGPRVSFLSRSVL